MVGVYDSLANEEQLFLAVNPESTRGPLSRHGGESAHLVINTCLGVGTAGFDQAIGGQAFPEAG